MKKIYESRYLFVQTNVDDICVSETWFLPHFSDLSIACDDYVVYRADRFSHAGGVAIYVNKKLNSTVKCKHPLDSEIEYLFLELSGKDLSSKALIECIYRPYRNIDYALLINVKDVITTGDLNSNILGEKPLLDSFKSIGLFSVKLHTPTHFNTTLLMSLYLFSLSMTSSF